MDNGGVILDNNNDEDVENGEPQNDENKLSWSPEKRLRYAALLIGIGFFGGILVMAYLNNLMGLGIFGISVFFSILFGSDLLSGTTKFNTGEVRKAIAVTVIAVYLMMPGFLQNLKANSPLLWTLNTTTTTAVNSTTTTTSTVLNGLLSNFWWVITAVIIFYFGSRIAKQIADKAYESKLQPSGGDQQSGGDQSPKP